MTPQDDLEHKLIRLCRAMVDQQAARVIVPPQHSKSGFWFGGGNMIEEADGSLWLVGRYRNQGDSRLGTGAGDRGLELAIFQSDDRGATFEKRLLFSKSDLDVSPTSVLSIEGCALRRTDEGVELFVSTEKTGVAYPSEFESYQKPGTGVWSIDVLKAETIEQLASADVRPLLSSSDPENLHIKDPFVYETSGCEMALLFCSHPFSWTSSNTGFAVRQTGTDRFDPPVYDFFRRGFTWDVAMTRGTAIVDLPRVGVLQNRSISLMFYDGGECVRAIDEHAQAVTRPRGYSCEELGGVAYFEGTDWRATTRLSKYEPLLVSPWGTGCSRYVDVLRCIDGMFITWQQSQSDRSQPLVMNYIANDRIENMLS